MSAKHKGIYVQFTSKFDPDVIERWTRMIEEWDDDRNKPNPYDEHVVGPLVFFSM
jgi:hypothetical protein